MDVEKHLNRARILMEQSRYELAEHSLKEVLALFPNHSEALGRLSYTYNRIGRVEDALSCAAAALNRDPIDRMAHYAICEIAAVNDKKEVFSKKILSAMQSAPQDAHFYYLFAFFLMKAREWQAALDKAKAGLKLAPTNQNLLHLHAEALYYLEDMEAAEKSLNFALKLNPWNPKSLESKGWLAMETEDWEAAKQFFISALQRNPNSITAKAGLVSIYKIDIPFYKYIVKWEAWNKRNPNFLVRLIGISFIPLIPVYILMETYKDTIYETYILIVAYIFLSPILIMGFMGIFKSMSNATLLRKEEAKHLLTKKEKENAQGCFWVLGILVVSFILLLMLKK